MLGIVIVAYKHPELTRAFVCEQLVRVDVPFCAIVVNNSSDEAENRQLAAVCGMKLYDETAEWEPGVYLWGTEENLGYARGNNMGVKLLARHFAISEWLFSNTDIELTDANVLSALTARMRSVPHCGSIGPRVLGRGGQDQSPYYDKPSLLRQIGWRLLPFMRNMKQVYPKPEPQEGECYWVIGAFVLVDSEAFERCGGFDERTFLYNEEAILSERMARLGYVNFFLPSVSVLHYERASTSGTEADSRRRQIEFASLLIYYRHYRGAGVLGLWMLKFAEWCYRKFMWRTLRHE